jgi:hypothetical protein
VQQLSAAAAESVASLEPTDTADHDTPGPQCARSKRAGGSLLLVAAGTMALAAVTVFAQSAMAGVLLLLAGLVAIGSVDAGHRYLVVHSIVTVLLEVLCLITGSSRGESRPTGRRHPRPDSTRSDRASSDSIAAPNRVSLCMISPCSCRDRRSYVDQCMPAGLSGMRHRSQLAGAFSLRCSVMIRRFARSILSSRVDSYARS